MCDAVRNMIAQARDQANTKTDDKAQGLLISDRDSNGIPVGIGGRRRQRRIDEIIESAETGLQIPRK